jgi:hypothetical protein
MTEALGARSLRFGMRPIRSGCILPPAPAPYASSLNGLKSVPLSK